MMAGGPMFRTAIRLRDRLHTIDGRQIETIEDYLAALRDHDERDAVPIVRNAGLKSYVRRPPPTASKDRQYE